MDEPNPYESPKAAATTPDAGVPISQRLRTHASAAGTSLAGAMVLVTFDVVVDGSFMFSFFVCPIWFLASVVKNAIQRPGRGIMLFRIAVPALTLGIVLSNNFVQRKIAHVHAERIIEACEEFHVAHARYPHTFDEIVPRYLGSIPRAKYCLAYGQFEYLNLDGNRPIMLWYDVPPFGRVTYNFEDRRWGYLD